MARLLKIQAIAAYCAFALALGFVLIDQAPDKGLRDGHRGWCSAHVLAIIEHATLSNAIVGHTMEYTFERGGSSFYYFDRYPPFFSAVMNVVLNVGDPSAGTKIYIARQVMNLLYIGTLIFAVALLVELKLAPGIAVAAVALAGSGKLLVYYRDMVHFDQAAMLGFMGLLWAIARWYRTRDNRFLYLATALAVLSGRGYASFAVLGIFWLVEAARALRTDWRSAPKTIVRSPQTLACLLSIALAASSLGYNIVVEAGRRDIPLTHVGIVKSAMRRLSLNEDFNKKKKKDLAWSRFSVKIAERGVNNLHPYIMDDLVDGDDRKQLGLAVGAVALVIAAFVATRKKELRPPLIIAALAGIAWIFPMRGLTAFHDFTTMFLFSLGVVFMAALANLVPDRAQLLPALLGCAVLVLSTQSRNEGLRSDSERSDSITRDLERVRAVLKPREVVTVEPEPHKLLKGVPYALGFYLPDTPLLIESKGNLVLAKKKPDKFPDYVNLTPENERVFLYRK